MGSYFLTANATKRQFIDPFRFGENARGSGYTQGFHFLAVAMLACDMQAIGGDPLAGSWAGDRIAIIPDDPGPEGYDDISYRVMAMLARVRPDFVEAMVARPSVLRHVGNTVTLVGSPELKAALVARLGKGWVKQYRIALGS